jgi:hypothetical protein
MSPSIKTGSGSSTASTLPPTSSNTASTSRSPHQTILNLPTTPPDMCDDGDSGPGTPMSAISTVAIKDGHAGHRPGMTGFDGATERISRLSAVSVGGYFDVNKRPDTPASTAGAGTGTGTGRPLQTDSPASTDSAREQRKEARLIDGMTYDEGVIDTTDRTPPAVVDEGR